LPSASDGDGTEFGLLSTWIFLFKIKAMINRVLNSKTKTVTFAVFLLALSGLFSRLLGLLRDNLLANLFPKSQTDIYFAAFRIPDFIYGILITGGIVAAFLPVFAESFKKDPAQAKSLTDNVLTFFLIGLVLISSILAIFTPQLIKFIVPGFSESQKALTCTLTRIMFLSPILLGISSILSGTLQYFNLFFAYALAPIFYNLGIIFGILFLSQIFGLKGLAFGVILGAFLHLLIQVPPFLKAGFPPRFSFNFRSEALKKILKLMTPRIIGTAAYQINLIVITAIASTLSIGAISVFNFSNNLQHVPIGLIGISFATATFPLFSRVFAENDKEKFSKSFSSIFSQILFLIIPLSCLIFLFRAHLVRLILGTSILGEGYFGWFQTRLTAASLGIFSFSLFAACLVPFLARIFFSIQNTRTPVKIAVSSMVLNIILCFLFVWLLSFPNFFQKTTIDFLKLGNIKDISVIALPLALSISVIFEFFCLILSLKRKIKTLNFQGIYFSLRKILLATFLMAVFTYLTLQIAALSLNTAKVLGLFLQTSLAALVGISSYFLLSSLLGLKELKVIWSSILIQFKKTQK